MQEATQVIVHLVEDSLPLDPTHGYRRGGPLILAGPFHSFLVMVHHVILKQIRFAQPLLLEHVFWWCLILVDAGSKSVHTHDGGARGANGQPRRQRRVRRAFADRHDCCRFGFWRGIRRLNITTALTGQSTADRLGSEEDVDHQNAGEQEGARVPREEEDDERLEGDELDDELAEHDVHMNPHQLARQWHEGVGHILDDHDDEQNRHAIYDTVVVVRLHEECKVDQEGEKPEREQ
mmetsp:Transcript_63010/g.152110  ORF Transcript_63010/g.152110 Transcript_63010/m.152110 type:complete len:235 (-) Transcript_63010:970-1674(-)